MVYIGITCLELQRGQEIIRKKEIKNVEKMIVSICEKNTNNIVNETEILNSIEGP